MRNQDSQRTPVVPGPNLSTTNGVPGTACHGGSNLPVGKSETRVLIIFCDMIVNNVSESIHVNCGWQSMSSNTSQHYTPVNLIH